MEHGRTPLEAPWYGYIMLLYNYIILYLSSQEVRLGYDDYGVSCKACTFSDSGHGSDGVCTVIPTMLVQSHPVSFHRRTVEARSRGSVGCQRASALGQWSDGSAGATGSVVGGGAVGQWCHQWDLRNKYQPLDKPNVNWLVVWNIFYFPFHIWDVILPNCYSLHHFSEG